MYDKIVTQFVKDRLKETSWFEREYINALIKLEGFISRYPHLGWMGGRMYNGLSLCNPVEKQCIWEEIEEGTYVDSEEFRKRLAQHAQKQREKRE